MKDNSNIQKYKRLAPFYDKFMGNRLFRKARQQAFSEIEVRKGGSLLLVGVGTGEDFLFLPADASITGIDLSEDMLRIAESKRNSKDITLFQMNAENMEFGNQKFDVVVLNLILSVVEHPEKVLEKSLNCLRQGGTLLVFDKFIDSNQKPNVIRRLLNKITSAIGTDITRDFHKIKSGFPIEITKEYKTINDLYTIIVARESLSNDISV
ncbi:class I SAM-dependent methyltransferase [Fictibacillus sp. BK138]|uniref:class I SAM-dependent methyltransferase n=1 Tax=Fictibacillus sp. BK138 TaxID=2512121 RepID=UPI0010E84FD5|nr:class I SAM-dependent methyltransferase [Fictibacillus sp. BK138]RZT16530.1 phosphatidylethanolamine/phosphatidyl-N-methylethanolamine N-methyltransferase [Fictibacillus sp. BK138]